jgi:hypothetical protein
MNGPIRVVDCFPYFNEKELLELRIKLLYDHVEKFIITDADHTHSGLPKPYTCRDTLNELGIPLDKIEIVEVNLPSYDQTNRNHIREALQRDTIKSILEDGVVYIITDCDEIINPEMIQMYASGVLSNPNSIVRLPLEFLNCRADLKVYHPNGIEASWNPGFMCVKQHTNYHTLSEIRASQGIVGGHNLLFKDIYLLGHDRTPVKAGWHFSWMGDRERIKTKMKSFLHSYDNNDYIFSTAIAPMHSEEMKNFLDSYKPEVGSTDPYGRSNHLLQPYPVDKLPKKIFELPRVEDFLFQKV